MSESRDRSTGQPCIHFGAGTPGVVMLATRDANASKAARGDSASQASGHGGSWSSRRVSLAPIGYSRDVLCSRRAYVCPVAQLHSALGPTASHEHGGSCGNDEWRAHLWDLD